MNYTIKIIFSGLASLFFLVSCKEGSESFLTQDMVSLYPELIIEQETATRKAETHFDNGEEVGILLLTTGGSLYGSSAGYEKYTYNNRRWECANPTMLQKEEAKVYAFYPYSSTLDYLQYGKQIPIGTTSQIDYLIGKQKDGTIVNERNPKVKIIMQHALSQIRFSIKKGSYAGKGKVTAATFSCTEGSLIGTGFKVDITSGSIVNTGSSVDRSKHNIGTWGANNIILKPEAYGPTGTEYLLIPGNGKIKIDLTVDNINYSILCNLDGSMTSNHIPKTLVAGSIYTINLRINGSALEIVSDNMVLHDWINGGSISTQ